MQLLLPDINVLVYAHREETLQHRVASAWLTAAMHGTDALCVHEQLLASFYRLGTNRRIYTQPTSLEDALSFANDVASAPATRMVALPQNLWGTFSDVCRDTGIVGAASSDAYLASVAICLNAQFVTFDSGFSMFPNLRWTLLKPEPETVT